MKKTIYIIITTIIVLMLAFSCTMQNSKNNGQVKFTFSSSAKSLQLAPKYSITDATSVQVTITDADNNTIYSYKILKLYKMGDGYISEPLALQVGDYHLTHFAVLDANNTVIFATPSSGSPRAYLVNNPLPIDFTVTKDNVTTITPEVLDTEGATPEDFGYSSFSIEEVDTFYFMVSVFIVGTNGQELTTADITISSGSEILYSGTLSAATNMIEVRDGYSSYNVQIDKAGYKSYTGTFTADELKGYFNSPLVVVLEQQ